MKKLLLLALSFSLVAAMALAEVKYIGEGEELNFDPASIPADKMAAYELMEIKCSTKDCHSIARAAEAIRVGVAPISKTPFDKQAAKSYGVKMMRRPDSGITKKEAKEIVNFLYYLIENRDN